MFTVDISCCVGCERCGKGHSWGRFWYFEEKALKLRLSASFFVQAKVKKIQVLSPYLFIKLFQRIKDTKKGNDKWDSRQWEMFDIPRVLHEHAISLFLVISHSIFHNVLKSPRSKSGHCLDIVFCWYFLCAHNFILFDSHLAVIGLFHRETRRKFDFLQTSYETISRCSPYLLTW